MTTTKITIEIEHDEDMPVYAIYDIFYNLEWGYQTRLSDLEEVEKPDSYLFPKWRLRAKMTNEDGYYWCENATQAAYEIARLSKLKWPTVGDVGIENWFNYMHTHTAYGLACDDSDTLVEHLNRNKWWIDKEFNDESAHYIDGLTTWLAFCKTRKPWGREGDECGYVIQYNE